MRIFVASLFNKIKLALLIVLAFLIGLINAKSYFYLLNVGQISKFITIFIFLILFVAFVLFVNNKLVLKRRISSLRYILPILFIFLAKYIFLYFSSPEDFIANASSLGVNFTTGFYLNKDDYFSEFYFLVLTFLSFILFICGIENIKQLSVICFSFLCGCAIAPLICFIFFPFMVGSRDILFHGVAFTGGFWNPSVIAFVSVFWLSIALTEYGPKHQKLISHFLLIVIILGALVGLSRSAYVCIGFSVLIYLVLSNSEKNKFILILLLFFGTVFFLKYFHSVIDNMQFRLTHERNISNELRLTIWKDYLLHLPDYWLFGSSAEGFRFYSSGNNGPHSIFINWFVRCGIFGFFAFLWLLRGVLRAIRKISLFFPREKVILLFAWLVSYFGLVTYNETGFLIPSFYIAFALIMAWGDLAVEGKRIV